MARVYQALKQTTPIHLPSGLPSGHDLPSKSRAGGTERRESQAATLFDRLTAREIRAATTRAFASADWEPEWDAAWDRLTRTPQQPSASEARPIERRQAASLEPLSPAAVEQFERLRTAVLWAAETRETQVLMVCGARTGDGASFVAQHLGRILARSGWLRVAHLEIKGSSATSTLPLTLLATELANLYEVDLPPAGGSRDPIGPAELATLLSELRRGFDLIVVDAPAVTMHPKSAALAPLADGVLLVANEAETPPALLTAAHTLLAESGADLLGLVLNRCQAAGSDRPRNPVHPLPVNRLLHPARHTRSYRAA